MTNSLIGRTISIRNAPLSKIGLQDLCFKVVEYLGNDLELVEIGAYAGDSGEIFALNFKKVHSVDLWLPGYDPKDSASNSDMVKVEEQFDNVCKVYPNINKLKMSSEVASVLFDSNSVDVVYIDGLHTGEGVKKDIKLWFPKVKPGGFLAFHDYGSRHFPEIKPAVDSILPGITLRFRDTSCLWRKL